MKFKFLIALCAIVLSACASAEPTQIPTSRPTAARPTINATPEPLPTLPAASAPTTGSPLALYDDKSAPFTIQYPRDWKIREEPESIVFTSPDQTATLQIVLYEYPEPAASGVTAKTIFDRFVQNNMLKTARQTTNADGSIGAEIEYADPGTRASMQGLLRVALAKDRRHHFIIQFAATQVQFARWKPLAQTVVESLRQR